MRAYYLNTTLPLDRLDEVRARLATLGLARDYGVADRGELIAVMRPDGTPFADLKAAENAQRQLVLQAYDLFRGAVVAFVDMPSPADLDEDPKIRTTELSSISSILASQNDLTLTQGKRVVLAVAAGQTLDQMLGLLADMGIETTVADTGRGALALVEDTAPDLLIADLQLADMHAWELLARAREIAGSRLLTAVIAAPTAEENHQAFGSTTAQIDAYLVSPFSTARFRLSIWLAFQGQNADDSDRRGRSLD